MTRWGSDARYADRYNVGRYLITPRMNQLKFLLVAVALASLIGCRRASAPEPAVATPAVTLSQAKAPLGSPIDITYRFDVAADAPAFAEDYRVFVGVVDADEELMWTDDHDPPIPTREWKPGQKVEYTRTVFIPVFPYIGDASIHMGLYSPTNGKRITLSGTDAGQKAYKVAKLQLQPQTENVFTVYKEGWHGPETPPNNTSAEWQWTKKEAVLGFRNPKKDSLFYLDVDNPSTTFPDGQHVQVMLGSQTIEDFTLPPAHRVLRKIPMTSAQLGAEDMLELRIVVDKTFVPALVPSAASKDPRELGVRVFHGFIGPKA
jgi:hypothetical protein